MKNKYKRLDVPKYYQLGSFYRNVELIETEAVFNKDGWYFDRETKQCWVEINGKSYVEKTDSFLWQFKLLNHNRLSGCERESIQSLINRNNCPKNLKEQLYLENEIKELRRIRLDARLSLSKHIKKGRL